MVVNAADVVTINVRQLPLDSVMRPAMFIKHCAELVPKSVAARQTAITYLADNQQDSSVTD